MRTMYIILSWIGWGWLGIAGTFLAVTLYRRRPKPQPRGSLGTEADVRP